VRAEYQRSYSALLLLWKGIGRLVPGPPAIECSSGPVSISSRYSDTSQQWLRVFLSQHHGDPSLAQLVEPLNRRPAWLRLPRRRSVASVDELDRLIARSRRVGDPGAAAAIPRLNATLLDSTSILPS